MSQKMHLGNLAIILSNLKRVVNFFHCYKQNETYNKCCIAVFTTPKLVAAIPCENNT